MTVQAKEVLIYNGERLKMDFYPSIPSNHPCIKDLYPNSRLFLGTDLYRGYLAEWEIKNGKFYLNKISGRYVKLKNEDKSKNIKKYEIAKDAPVFADWFSGVIIFPRGEEIICGSISFMTFYKEELHVKIKEGVVVEEEVKDFSFLQYEDKDARPTLKHFKDLPTRYGFPITGVEEKSKDEEESQEMNKQKESNSSFIGYIIKKIRGLVR